MVLVPRHERQVAQDYDDDDDGKRSFSVLIKGANTDVLGQLTSVPVNKKNNNN